MKKEKKIWEDVMNIINEKEITLGKYFSHQVFQNTKHLLFTLSRYKFAAKMLVKEPKISVLELGCNEGVGTLVLKESAESVTAIDFHKPSIDWAKNTLRSRKIKFIRDNFLSKVYGRFDAVVSIDVIEHINPDQTNVFMKTILKNLENNGFCIVGTPNKTAKKYASPESKKGHINLFTANQLREIFFKYFENVFLFGMNDEVIHTGFEPMCHYLFVLACSPIAENR